MSTLRLTENDGILLLEIQVAPRASRAAILGLHDGRLKVALTAPPVEGAANKALVALLAKQLGLARRQVQIVRGERSRQKTVALSGADAAAVRALAQTAS